MSHQVLARKWRPGNFTEMVGQQHVLQALVNALESGRLHHAYLFTGTRGVGKTTVARILAKCLNCDQGVSATPCGECGACAEITEGRSVDLIEVDAASKTKVEDTRELLENVQYTPTRARYKIYLIDEVHMLSNHSFNALLKTLEEPPPHALFLLATTDPQKLPATVLSRCLQFNLKNMQPEQIVAHLQHILSAESIDSDAEALALIARAAEGSMRDALSLTDQAIAYGQGSLAGAQVAEMLGTVDRGKALDLVAAILSEDAAAVLALVAQIAEHAPDFVSTIDELSNIFHQMTIAQTVPDALDTSWPDQARIVELAAQATLDDTQLFWQIAVSGRREVHLASSARAGLEMILLRMIAFRPAAVIQPPSAVGDPPAKKSEPPATPVDLSVAPVVDQKTAHSDKSASSSGLATAAKRARASESGEESAQGSAARGGQDSSAHADPAANTPPVATDSHVHDAAAVGDEPVADAAPTAALPTQSASQDTRSLFDEDARAPVVAEPAASPTQTTAGAVMNGNLNGAVQADPVDDSGATVSDVSPASWEALSPETWPEAFEAFTFTGILHNIALNLELVALTEDQLRFSIAEEDAMLLNERHPAQLGQALSQQLGQPVTAQIAVAVHQGRTPARRRARLAAERLQDAERAISNDDALHALMEAFDGHIIPGSIRPNLAEGDGAAGAMSGEEHL